MTTAPHAQATATPYTARCRCGRVTVEAASAPILQLTCHCTQCRQASGQHSTNFAFFKAASTVVTGERSVVHFVADTGAKTTRESCAACADMMIDRTEGYPKIVGVVAERISPPYAFQPRCHVWLQEQVAEPAATPDVALYQRGMP